MIVSKLPVILAEKKLRVADVVRATGMSKSTLHKLYNEESSRIDFNTIDQLCEFLDVQVGYVVEDMRCQLQSELYELLPHSEYVGY